MKPHNLANRFRQRRMERFVELVGPLDTPVRILDIGGTADYWRALPTLYGAPNVEITIVNLGVTEFDESNLHVRHGNACSLPQYKDMSFDVVHSNSVIEHVGPWEAMRAMASEVRRLAPKHFVQTPNKWFPIEPHYKLPLVQFLPVVARAYVVRKLKRHLGDDQSDILKAVRNTRLLGARQMRSLFPDSALERERLGGLTKSIIAIRPAR